MIENISHNQSVHSMHQYTNNVLRSNTASTLQISTLQGLHESKLSLAKIFYSFLIPIKLIWNFITAPIRWTFNLITRCCRPKTEWIKTLEQTKKEKFNEILKLIDAEKETYLNAFSEAEKIYPHVSIDSKKAELSRKQLIPIAQKGIALAIKAEPCDEEDCIQINLRLIDLFVFRGNTTHGGFSSGIELYLDMLSGTPQEKFQKAYDIAFSQRKAMYPFEGKCNQQSIPYWDSNEIKFYASNGIAFMNKAFQYATSNQEKAKLYFELAVFSFFLGKEKEGSEYMAKARSHGFCNPALSIDYVEKAYKEYIQKYRRRFYFW